jgi:prepilin-type N-terminal cleavage/methylation domain-containing protein
MTVRSKAGFSLTELTVVVAIILIVSGLSLPSLTRVIDTVRVKTAAQQTASLYQQARIRATQDDAYYNVLLANGNSSICLDLDGDGKCGGNDPITTLGNGAVLSNAGIPVQLDSTILGFTPLTAESSTTYTPQGATVSALEFKRPSLPKALVHVAVFELGCFGRRRTGWVDSVCATATSRGNSNLRRGGKPERPNKSLELCTGWNRCELALRPAKNGY